MKIFTFLSVFMASCALVTKFHEQGHGYLSLLGFFPAIMYIIDNIINE